MSDCVQHVVKGQVTDTDMQSHLTPQAHGRLQVTQGERDTNRETERKSETESEKCRVVERQTEN